MTTTASPSALTVSGLRKSFGEKTVLDGIDFDVAGGTTYSLLGPNGAGKTTTVQILSTLLSPDAGEVRVAGFDLALGVSMTAADPPEADPHLRRRTGIEPAHRVSPAHWF